MDYSDTRLGTLPPDILEQILLDVQRQLDMAASKIQRLIRGWIDLPYALRWRLGTQYPPVQYWTYDNRRRAWDDRRGLSTYREIRNRWRNDERPRRYF